MGKFVLAMISTVVLLGMLGVTVKVQKAEVSGTIYIRADGSVDPPTANITSVDNLTYTFTGNIFDSIVVERSSIVVDGAEHTIQGTGAVDSKGIHLFESTNVTIRNIEVKAFHYGIFLRYSSNNAISGNNVTNNGFGISLYDFSNNNVIAGNNVSSSKWQGILLYNSINNTVTRNAATHNNYNGIAIENYSSNNAITNNTATHNDKGIGLWDSTNNLIANNLLSNNNFGIMALRSHHNTITTNLLSNNNFGIWFGVHHSGAGNNTIYLNDFVDNTEQARNTESTNTWDNGYPSGGNYWSDYADVDQYRGQYQNETGSDGIWDHPYIIDESNQDNYPIVPEFPSFHLLFMFINATILGAIIYGRSLAKQERKEQRLTKCMHA